MTAQGAVREQAALSRLADWNSIRVLFRAFGYLRRYWRVVAGAYAAVLVITGLNVFIPQLIRGIIDRGLTGGDLSLCALGGATAAGPRGGQGRVHLLAAALAGGGLAKRRLRYAQRPADQADRPVFFLSRPNPRPASFCRAPFRTWSASASSPAAPCGAWSMARAAGGHRRRAHLDEPTAGGAGAADPAAADPARGRLLQQGAPAVGRASRTSWGRSPGGWNRTCAACG